MTSGAGRVLGGRYTLLTPIAQGGMGEVWKARDRVSGHIVAAKVLRPELTGEELSLSRLRLEARNSMSISHPNIANTQDSGEEDGIGWIIMELVDGHPLTDYLRGGSRIEPEYLMPILVQVAMALGAAARAGVVHRDIKPANIIVRPDGMVKLTDFGISRAKGQVNLTAAGMVMGTAQYLPPEQAMGEVATPIGDLYALGVIAYEAAAGRRPFTGETQVDIAFAHVNDPVPPLPDFVPEPLADVILHLLEKDPAKRPESGSAAVREIASAAKAMGVSVTPRPLPLPKAAQRPEEVRTPVQPSVPIVAPVRHLTRRTLPDEMLQPPSGLTPKVRATTGRHAKLPVLDPDPDHGSPRRRPAHPRRGRGSPDLSPRVHSHPGSSPAPRDDRRAGARSVGCRPIADLDRSPRSRPGPRGEPAGTGLGPDPDAVHGQDGSRAEGSCARCSYARPGRHHPHDHGFHPEARGSHSLRAGPAAQQRDCQAPPGLGARAAFRAYPGPSGRCSARAHRRTEDPAAVRAAGSTRRPRRAIAPTRGGPPGRRRRRGAAPRSRRPRGRTAPARASRSPRTS